MALALLTCSLNSRDCDCDCSPVQGRVWGRAFKLRAPHATLVCSVSVGAARIARFVSAGGLGTRIDRSDWPPIC
eukprot:9207430-Alexandrium_andersonii.AAC.1